MLLVSLQRAIRFSLMYVLCFNVLFLIWCKVSRNMPSVFVCEHQVAPDLSSADDKVYLVSGSSAINIEGMYNIFLAPRITID